MDEYASSIDHLELETRPSKALRASKIETVGEVIDLILSERLHLVPGIWRKGEAQTKAAVARRLATYLK